MASINNNFSLNKYTENTMKQRYMSNSESQNQFNIKNPSNIISDVRSRHNKSSTTNNLHQKQSSETIEKLIEDLEVNQAQTQSQLAIQAYNLDNIVDQNNPKQLIDRISQRFGKKTKISHSNINGDEENLTMRNQSQQDLDEKEDADFQSQLRGYQNQFELKPQGADLDRESILKLSAIQQQTNITVGKNTTNQTLISKLSRIKINAASSSNINEKIVNSQMEDKNQNHNVSYISGQSISADGPTGITQMNIIPSSPKIIDQSKLQKQNQQERVNAILRSIKSTVIAKVLDISEFSTKFHVGRFLRIFCYHILFWFTGPLLVLPIVLIFDSIGLAKNMSFWFGTTNKNPLYLQLFMTIVTIFMLVMCLLQKFDHNSTRRWIDGIYLEQFLFFTLHLIIRSFIISVRYGSCSELRFSMLKENIQSQIFINKDLLGAAWLIFNPVGGLLTEINSCMWRNQIEDQLFRFKFIEELDSEYAKRLQDDDYYGKPLKDSDDPKTFEPKFVEKVRKQEIKDFEERAELQQLLEDLGQKESVSIEEEKLYTMKLPKNSEAMAQYLDKNSYSGKQVLKEICLFAGSFQINAFLCFLFAIIRFPIPYIVRQYEGKTNPYKFGWDSWVYQILDSSLGTFIVALNFLFVIAGLVDFQRRKIMIQACGTLIEPQKANFDSKYRLFPTINLIDSQSLQSWFMLRLSIMDIGRKYMTRISIYSSTFMGAYFFYAVILMLQYFDFIQIKFTLIANAYAMYDIAFVMTTIVGMLWYGSAINHQYIEDIKQLLKIKYSLVFIKANYQRVLDPAYDVAEGEQPKKFQYDRIHGIYLKIFQRLYFAQQKQDGVTLDEQKDHIADLIEEISSMIERLQLDEEHQPLKLLGIKTSYDLMSQIYTTIAGLVIAVGQKVVTGVAS